MKTTLDLLNAAVELGYERSEALESIDMALDDELGSENRKAIAEEELSEELYKTILDSFKEESEF